MGHSIDLPEPPVVEESETNIDDVVNCDRQPPKASKTRRESLKQIKSNIKEGVKEAKAEIKEQIKHLPDGHRGSIASVTERPPYRTIHNEPEGNGPKK